MAVDRETKKAVERAMAAASKGVKKTYFLPPGRKDTRENAFLATDRGPLSQKSDFCAARNPYFPFSTELSENHHPFRLATLSVPDFSGRRFFVNNSNNKRMNSHILLIVKWSPLFFPHSLPTPRPHTNRPTAAAAAAAAGTAAIITNILIIPCCITAAAGRRTRPSTWTRPGGGRLGT
jgi:hypothetical protein